MHGYDMINYGLIVSKWIKFLGLMGVRHHGCQMMMGFGMVCKPIGRNMLLSGIMLMAHYNGELGPYGY